MLFEKRKDILEKAINEELRVDLDKELILINKESIDFDFAIVITGHKNIHSTSKKIFTYSYDIDESKHHYAGRSLITAVEKIENIIKRLT
ncbi:MAG: hypothetical protein KKC75_01620 [Nanoarchaeota archaeon]|nr:hypothetical protein [Nanoarchaeota archaeon]MBU1004670.1 hypothetical protein [Nanoarchaeota archaeon]MBU1945782.1 hypothetical protein [Nanoarchaeota archaeon]